ncbi:MULTISPECIES: YjjG family noncanonical pyrimidine nucleotidase [Tenacibaculum]|uniref:Noncanonical pyrimidine nucleotidase, YjjG family n=2 Tax=Tenacibaculum TaxID=104267 RepID=A0ABM7CJ64_9FLAO|nr:YjjG family noncanonical pyrimidine nucleotidase [Tenacibaculum mesophilum]GFD92243.1 noncanonical pyrimidine nucleotidase, YjjG family protein [Alteromonas sp. KUL154]GFE01742.1 noncanonical pyrimidine nucleotidase, YjjG family protein [Alteromonas sp. KUL156]AZJ33827.1 noncanonical pyrimidine nucleotidase, YjjG family [Tenacibaculum mesophilum]KAF9660058.1 noncanonical pyrimidine nucleotidase, YjjG family [Tenacibaculum mesophilum]QFS29068.1 noncanonical pyrimidine nucleotidase, YjjG fami
MDIKHLFFDLDHTLWDFDKNSKLTFNQIFKEQNITIPVGDFLKVYMPLNFKFWKLYREDKIEKSALRYYRLKETFDNLNYEVSDDLINQISKDYIEYLPNFNHLFDNTKEVLEYLEKKYDLHIITNGFEEVQKLKLKKSGISNFFKQVITSECVGAKKPNSKVFKFALEKAGAKAKESVMIGDNYEADIIGALNSEMKVIHFSEEIKSKDVQQITSLIELKKYL